MRPRSLSAIVSIVLAVFLVDAARAGTSTFETEILKFPPIAQPGDPFVTIFFEGGVDNQQYGFRTNGTVNQQDWQVILTHVGYLAPYSIFNPYYTDTWNAFGMDVAVRAAQAIGRQSGGSIQGAPTTADEITRVQGAYADPLSLGMNYFFHDAEGDLGTPGGSGNYRLRVDYSKTGSLAAANSSDFNTQVGGLMESFNLSFEFYEQNFVFGGGAVLLGCRNGGYGVGGRGWYVKIWNPTGFNGQNYIWFGTDDTGGLLSLPFNNQQGELWNKALITVGPATDPAMVTVTIAIDGVGSTSGVIKRPTVFSTGLTIGDGNSPMSERQMDYDNIMLVSTAGGGSTTVASYSFETEQGIPVTTGQPVTRVPDLSGRMHELTPAVAGPMFAYFPTTGIDPAVAAPIQQHLINDLLSIRSANGAPDPILLTNWSLSDRPGRFAAWKPYGFTNGSTDYYAYRNIQPGFGNINDILHTERTQWAWNDGSNWQHVWWGNVTFGTAGTPPITTVMTPAQQQTALTLAVLDGNRWFSVFTSMSNGTLADYSAFGDSVQMATVNADVLYALAQAASWFQSTSASLKDSIYVPLIQGMPPDLAPFCRARQNTVTNEFWFAGFSPQGDRLVSIPLPAQAGVVTDLATGAAFIVTDGTFPFTLTGNAQPYYFRPGPVAGLTLARQLIARIQR